VWSTSFHRRHLSESQRAIAVAKFADFDVGRPELNTAPAVITQKQAVNWLQSVRDWRAKLSDWPPPMAG